MHWWPVLLLCVIGCRFIAGNCWNGSKHPDISKFIRTTENYYPVEPELILKGELFQIGDFNDCVYEREEQYCMTTIFLGPAYKPSEFWQRIEKITNTNARFRRDLLHVGVCVPRQCKSSDVTNGFKSALTEAASKLGITVNITIERNACQTNDRPPVHQADYIIICVIVPILVLVASGSLYDAFRNRQNPVGPVETISGQLLMCFSIQNNWKRLGTVCLSEDTKDFTHLQGLRTISMGFIVMGHAVFVQINMGIRNPEWLEKSYSDFFRTSFFNGALVMATFLCISGFLLGSLFFREIEKYGFYKRLIIAIIYRYIRLTPVYAVIILFVAGWMNHMSTGPMHYSVVEPEVQACRENWWLNILFINNYVVLEDQCVIHGWYLAADYQCYIVSSILLVIVCKYPNYARTILALTLIVFGCIPALQTYLERLDPTLLIYPEAIVNLAKDRTFQRSHVTFHNNFTAYFVGVIYGYGYYCVKRNGVKSPRLLEVTMYICALVLPWSFFMLGFIFYQPSYKYDVYTATLYACIHKGLFACGIGAIILALSLGYRYARPIYIFLSWKPFQIVGRLTYITYLVHLYLQRIVIGGQKYPLYITEGWIILATFSYIVVSTLVALILCLAIEMPCSALSKIIFNPDRAKQYLQSRKCKNVNDVEMKGYLHSSLVAKQNVITLSAENHDIRTHL